MSLDLYHTLLDLAISQPNVELLVKVWHDSVALNKKDMIELNERILHAIPKLRKRLRIPGDPKDFKKFVEDYDEQQYTQQCSRDHGKCLMFFARKGDWRNVRKAIEKGANQWVYGLQGAAEGGWMDLVEFFWEKLEEKNPSSRIQRNNADIGLSAAARGGHFNLVKFFLEKGAKNLSSGLANAARGGHLELVKFFIAQALSNPRIGEKGVKNEMNSALHNAAGGGHRDLVEFFIEKGAKDFNSAMNYAARGGYKDLVLFFEKKGGSDWDGVLREAAIGGYLDIVKLAIEKGAKNFNKALKLAAIENHLKVVKYLVEQGATELEEVFALAATRSEMEDDSYDDRSEVIDYLESQVRR